MATPFDRFGIREAEQIIARRSSLSDSPGFNVTPLIGTGKADSAPRPMSLPTSVALVRRMLGGDMWLDATGWIGPRPGPDEDGYAYMMLLIAQAFVSQNCLADVIDRHVAGVLGREPHWGFTVRRALKQDEKPTAEEQRLIDEAESIVTEWWNTRKVHALLQQLARTLLYAHRAPTRLFVPRGKMQRENIEGRTVSTVVASTIEEAIAKIWPEAPMPERAAVAVDEDTRDSVGVSLSTSGIGVTGIGTAATRADIVYLTDDGQSTVIRQSGNAADISRGVTLNLGGRLTMHEMEREPFLSPQMLQLQRAVNLCLTALGRGVVTSGWLERIIANAVMPGEWVDALDSAGQKTGRQVWRPTKNVTGAGSTTYLEGIKETDLGSGAERRTTPTVTFRDPSSLAPLVEAFSTFYGAILREAKQEHVLMSQDVKASGKSREQARADFEMTLRKSVAEIEACGRWLIETPLAMAEAFARTPGKYTGTLAATFTCKVDTGPITSDEREANDASYKAGTLSREGAMEQNNVTDVDAELARINAETGAEVDLRTRIATAIASLVTAGSGIEEAALFMGVDKAEAAALVPTFEEGQDANGNPLPVPAAKTAPPTPDE